MAEGSILAFVQNIVGSLAPHILKEFGRLRGAKTELEALRSTASIIEPLLGDAEEKYNESPHFKAWFRRLKDVFLDIEDLLDEISTAALRHEVRSNPASKFISSAMNKVRIPLIAYKIKAARENIDAIKGDTQFLRLKERPTTDARATKRELSHSFVPDEEILGRDNNKREIIELLLETGVEESVSVIPIVAIGGLGKTALAQSVFNHEKIRGYFEQTIWACVSNVFDMKSIMRQIIGSEQKMDMEMEQLQITLRRKINGNRYLLVLDDFWSDDNQKWSSLKNLLMGGARGSKILITTRLNSVAEITGTVPQPYLLGCLSEEISRSLFLRMAFRPGEEMMYPDFIPIGEQIIRKCKGVPLAIRSLASLLRIKRKKEEWLQIKDQALSKINTQQEDYVLNILKLSYDHLPSHLKQCFAYCSLFPKGYRVKKDDLIQLWMACGLIQSANTDQHLEDVGEDYFMDLVMGNFFQDLQNDELGNVESCKMHDLMHEVAVSVAGVECISSGHNADVINMSSLHVSYESVEDLPEILPKCSNQAKKLRTILCLAPTWSYICGETTIPHKDLSRLRRLRVLDLHKANIKVVPSCISELQHLRELDLSYNPIKELPRTLVELYNLQTLKLRQCEELKELPNDIRKLAKLRHLDIIDCQKLSHMPRGLRALTSLHTLSKFVVCRVGSALKDHAWLNELSELDNLSGKFEIENLGWTKEAVLESKGANLSKKGRLKKLNLRWSEVRKGRSDEERFANHEAMLEGLQPHPNLRCLLVERYEGTTFPRWMVNDMIRCIPNLVEIRLQYCPNLRRLPPLGQLPLLKTLELSKLDMVDCIEDSSNGRGVLVGNNDDDGGVTVVKGTSATSSNEIVRKLDDDDDPVPCKSMLQPAFPRLSKLSINGCPKLTSLPIFPQLEQLSLSNLSEGILHRTVNQLPSRLKKLSIWDVSSLEKVPTEWLQGLASLESMSLGNCPNLTSLSLSMQNLTKLTRLDILECKELDISVDENGDPLQLQGLTNLRDVRIIKIPKLVLLPEWLLHLTNLEHLYLFSLYNLVSLPGWIGDLRSLRSLSIFECPNLKLPPKEMSKLRSSVCLNISRCPLLSEVC